MAAHPEISFHLPDRERSITPQDPRWTQSLPTYPSAAPPLASSDTPVLSYGEYFEAIAHFLERNEYRHVRRAVGKLLPSTSIPDKWKIKIVSEKHGAFYHPARIQVDLGHRTLDLVINLALSEAGRRVLPQEVENLLRLELEFGLTYLPRVFGSGELTLDARRKVSLFLGEWFGGYFEFHLASHPRSGRAAIHLWEPGRRDRFLTRLESEQLFFQAALILTSYYNPLTTEQLFPWHHAAGDFLFRPDASSDDSAVRLITVRGYKPLIRGFPDPPATQDIVDGLVLFFLQMGLRLRLDRLSGVGQPAWIGPQVLAPILNGFRAGLEFQTTHYGLPLGFARRGAHLSEALGH